MYVHIHILWSKYGYPSEKCNVQRSSYLGKQYKLALATFLSPAKHIGT